MGLILVIVVTNLQGLHDSDKQVDGVHSSR